MSNHLHIDHLLSDYLDGEMSDVDQLTVELHLARCAACREKLAQLQTLVSDLNDLPLKIDAPHNLWQSIEAEVRKMPRPMQDGLFDREPVRQRPPVWFTPRWPNVRHWKIAAAAGVAVLITVGIFFTISQPNAYELSMRSGAPLVDDAAVTASRRIQEGAWITTDAASEADLKVGAIGSVTIAPDTRLQVRSTSRWRHTLNLNVGRIHARIWAPPRRFFVETPAGLAIDLGCEYTLEVDSSGHSVLHVISGFVGFARNNREVIAPAGWLVRARPGRAPGTPYTETASDAFQRALERFDFGSYSRPILTEILAEARPEDAISLLELIWRTRGVDRARVYDRLTGLVDPPHSVTREGVLARDPEMMNAWRNHLGVGVTYWLEYKKKKKG